MCGISGVGEQAEDKVKKAYISGAWKFGGWERPNNAQDNKGGNAPKRFIHGGPFFIGGGESVPGR